MEQKKLNLKNFYVRWSLTTALIVAFTVASISNVQAYTYPRDSLALVALYNSTDGENWDYNTGWLTSDVCLWDGIIKECNGNYVEEIVLQDFGLNGALPSELGNMTDLIYFEIIDNENVSGSIPTTLGNLTNLEYLHLGSNSLSGSIPSSLSNLTNLTTLWLDDNNLTGSIPDELTNLTSLQYLGLSDNNLSGHIYYGFYYMIHYGVVDMDIRNNNFVFADLISIAGAGSRLHYAPQKKVGETMSIEVPYFSDYELEIPNYNEHSNDEFTWYKDGISIATTTTNSYIIEDFKLGDEGVYYCKVTNSILPALTLTSYNITLTATNPYNISETELDALWALWIATDGPNWTNNTGWWTNTDVENWYGISLYSNHVDYIELNNNNLNGSIPDGFCYLSHMQELDLSENNLSGSIPSAFSNLSALYDFDCYGNNLSGIIPQSLAIFWWLDISENSFVFADMANLNPQISNIYYDPQAQIGAITTISVLKYSDYELTIPDYTAHEDDVFHWYKDGVAITGSTIEDFSDDDDGVYYCQVTNSNFPALTLTSYNITLSATNPYNISETELDALWALWVYTDGPNWTTKTGWWIDTDVENWYGITLFGGKVDQINLANNNLIGTLPTELGNLSKLLILDLYGNSITGSIPPELGKLSSLFYLYLSGNSLTGFIPPELGNLKYLYALALQNNGLTGSIPPELGNCNLQYLELYDNFLTGIVPEWICDIPHAWIKTYYGNNIFSPPYPTCWDGLKSALITQEIDPSEIMEGCIKEAMNSNIEPDSISDYIESCMAEKMEAKQATAVTSFESETVVKAYPNPTTGILNIESPYESSQLHLYNFAGQKVMEQDFCKGESIDISHLRKGMYLLVVEAEGQQENIKITLE